MSQIGLPPKTDMTIYSGLNSSLSNLNGAPNQMNLNRVPSQNAPVSVSKQRVAKTLKAMKYGGSTGAILPSSRSDDDGSLARTDFFVWGSDKHGQLG